MSVTIIQGNALTELAKLPTETVHCCVTSPPYWGLRDYGVATQLGLERTPEEYVEKMVGVFAEVRRVLRDDGTLWLNIGDSYARMQEGNVPQSKNAECQPPTIRGRLPNAGLKAKDLVGIPWRLAFALQAAGWYLRADIIWHKLNPMPESMKDRPTKSHEYIFLLAKQERYYYDAEAIKEPSEYGSQGGCSSWQTGRAIPRESRKRGTFNGKTESLEGRNAFRAITETRNKRSVWTVPTAPFKDAHFATFPPALIRPCILAGCPMGGTVLDPFAGSGTTGEVAEMEGRNSILIELNPKYIAMIRRRTAQAGLFCKG